MLLLYFFLYYNIFFLILQYFFIYIQTAILLKIAVCRDLLIILKVSIGESLHESTSPFLDSVISTFLKRTEQMKQCCISVFLKLNFTPVILVGSKPQLISHNLARILALNINTGIHRNHQLPFASFLIRKVVNIFCFSNVKTRPKLYHILILFFQFKVHYNMSMCMNNGFLVRSFATRTRSVLPKGYTRTVKGHLQHLFGIFLYFLIFIKKSLRKLSHRKDMLFRNNHKVSQFQSSQLRGHVEIFRLINDTVHSFFNILIVPNQITHSTMSCQFAHKASFLCSVIGNSANEFTTFKTIFMAEIGKCFHIANNFFRNIQDIISCQFVCHKFIRNNRSFVSLPHILNLRNISELSCFKSFQEFTFFCNQNAPFRRNHGKPSLLKKN